MYRQAEDDAVIFIALRRLALLCPRLNFAHLNIKTVLFIVFCIIILNNSFVNTAKADISLKEQFGQWKLFCGNKDLPPSPRNCALVTAVVDTMEPNYSARAGVSAIDESGEIEFTIKVPNIRFIKSGVIISSLKGEILRAYFDECANGGCTTAVRLDTHSLEVMLTSPNAWLEYQIDESKTIRLPLNLEYFGEAVTALYKSAGVGSEKYSVANIDNSKSKESPVSSTRVVVEIRKKKSEALKAKIGGVAKCKSAESKKVFSVNSSYKIKDRNEVDEWLTDAAPCLTESVLLVKSANITDDDHSVASFVESMKVFQVYEMLRGSKQTKEVVFAGRSNANRNDR